LETSCEAQDHVRNHLGAMESRLCRLVEEPGVCSLTKRSRSVLNVDMRGPDAERVTSTLCSALDIRASRWTYNRKAGMDRHLV
jgi:hypothetical protein